MVAGLETISAGTLRIEGAVVNDVAARERDIAMVFQSYALYPQMTAAQNIGFGLKLRRTPQDEISSAVEREALDLHEGDEVLFRVERSRAVIGKTHSFLEMAGSVPVPATKRGTAWDDVLRETRGKRAERRR